MEMVEGYKNDYEKKIAIMHVRMDQSMINQLNIQLKKEKLSFSELKTTV